MTDDALRELLRSPLDHDPPRRVPAWIAWLVAGIAAGILLSLAVLPSLRSDGAGAAAPAATSIAGPSPGLTAVGDGLAIEALWSMTHGDAVWISFATTVVPGAKPADVPAAPTMEWILTTGSGRQIPSSAAVVDPQYPGLFTVAFPAGREGALAGADITVRPASVTLEDTVIVDLDADGLPWDGLIPPVEAGNAAVVVDSVDLHDDGGSLRWHLEGPPGVQVSVVTTFDYTVAGTDERRSLVSETLLPGVFLQLEPPPPAPARAGEIILFRTDDPDDPTFRSRWWGDDDPIDLSEISLTMDLIRYDPTGSETTFSIDEVPVVRDGG